MPGKSDATPIQKLPALTEEDYYFEGEFMVFTAAYHRKRGYCCGSGCRHCPFRDTSESRESARQFPAPDPAAEG